MNGLRGAGVLALLCLLAGVSQAGTTVWGFNASFGNPHIQAYDLTTGVALADFVAPNQDANRGRANGRGIAVVGTTIYYSLADTPNVYVTDTLTHADLGIAFTTILTPGINSLAWDGSSLWMVASQPNNPSAQDDNVYQYSLTGKLLRTLVLTRPPNNNLSRDGLEVTPTGIVANRGSVPYDVYDFNGNLIKPVFITASFRTTGIAFDGTNYIVSDVINGRLATYDTSGNFVRSVALTGAAIPFGIVDLSAVSSQTGLPPQGKVAIFRNAGALGMWVLDSNGNNAFDLGDTTHFFGLPGDQVVAGDWTGNGQVRLGVFRGGSWFLDLNNNGQWDGVAGGDGIFAFGLPGDLAVVGDWNGDGRTKLGIFRCPPPGTPGVCTFVLDKAGKFFFDPATAVTMSYGLPGDRPVASNWGGTGLIDQIGVYRNGAWIVDSNGDGVWEPSDAVYSFGLAGDIPVVGNWSGTGRKRIGIFRPSVGFWVLDTNGNNAFDLSDQLVFFGLPGDLAAVGNWTL
jgi:hypothetical protein